MLKIFAFICLGTTAAADTVVAVRTLRPNTVIQAHDLQIQDGDTVGGVEDLSILIGMEAKVAIYAGRPVHLSDVGPPAIVERNQLISLVYQQGTLTIMAEGRALERAGVGDVVRVMNLSSRNTVNARIGNDGAGYVGY